MKYFLLSLTFILTSLLYGQSIKNKYSSMTGENGSVYFIHKQKGFKCEDLKKNKDLYYDITYSSLKDSINYNFTYHNKIATPLDSVRLRTNSGELIKTKSSIIYVEPSKQSWKHRASFVIPKETTLFLYNSELPYEIILYSKKNYYIYKINTKNWKKNSEVVRAIFDIIKYSQH